MRAGIRCLRGCKGLVWFCKGELSVCIAEELILEENVMIIDHRLGCHEGHVAV